MDIGATALALSILLCGVAIEVFKSYNHALIDDSLRLRGISALEWTYMYLFKMGQHSTLESSISLC